MVLCKLTGRFSPVSFLEVLFFRARLVTKAAINIQQHSDSAVLIHCQVGLAIIIEVSNRDGEDASDAVAAADGVKFCMTVTQKYGYAVRA